MNGSKYNDSDFQQEGDELFSSSYWKEQYKNLVFQSLEEYLKRKATIDPHSQKNIPKIRKIIFEDKDFLYLSNKIINYDPKKKTSLLTNESKIQRVYTFHQFFNRNKLQRFIDPLTLRDTINLVNIIFSKSFYNFSLSLKKIFENQYKDYMSGLIILTADEYTLLFLPYFYYNIDNETQKNFYVNCNDEIFHFESKNIDSHNYEVLKVTKELLNNRYFIKRFSYEFIKNIRYIVYQYLKLGMMEFFLVYFFKEEKLYENFFSNAIMGKISKILSFTYPLFRRNDLILFDRTRKIQKRMVFSYKYFLIKKIIKKRNHIKKISVYLDDSITDYDFVNKNVHMIKSYYQNNPKFILIRNHFFKLSFFFEDSDSLEDEFWILWNKFSKHLEVEYTLKKEKYDLYSWSFLDF